METIISRTLLVILALTAALMYARREQWENAITRLMVAGVFIAIMVGVPLENMTVNLLIRWLFVIIFFVEILAWALRIFIEENKNGRR